MIKAQELRIDNWVQVTNEYLKRIISGKVNKYQQVENVWSFGINISSGYEGSMEAEFNMEDIEGIPLSPSILEKAGFVKTDEYNNSYEKTIGFTFYEHLEGYFVISENGGVYRKYFEVDEDTFYSWHGTEIKFLHHLQNYFYCERGEELTINL
jgi:hypothetical protein